MWPMCHCEEDLDTVDTACAIPKHMHTYKDSQSLAIRHVGANTTLLITDYEHSIIVNYNPSFPGLILNAYSHTNSNTRADSWQYANREERGGGRGGSGRECSGSHAVRCFLLVADVINPTCWIRSSCTHWLLFIVQHASAISCLYDKCAHYNRQARKHQRLESCSVHLSLKGSYDEISSLAFSLECFKLFVHR